MSSLENTISTLSTRVRDFGETIATEEAVKTSVVLPFLQSLGYDVFNPAEVVPEFTADAVGKKGEKVDYAIKLNVSGGRGPLIFQLRLVDRVKLRSVGSSSGTTRRGP